MPIMLLFIYLKEGFHQKAGNGYFGPCTSFSAKALDISGNIFHTATIVLFDSIYLTQNRDYNT